MERQSGRPALRRLPASLPLPGQPDCQQAPANGDAGESRAWRADANSCSFYRPRPAKSGYSRACLSRLFKLAPLGRCHGEGTAQGKGPAASPSINPHPHPHAVHSQGRVAFAAPRAPGADGTPFLTPAHCVPAGLWVWAAVACSVDRAQAVPLCRQPQEGRAGWQMWSRHWAEAAPAAARQGQQTPVGTPTGPSLELAYRRPRSTEKPHSYLVTARSKHTVHPLTH